LRKKSDLQKIWKIAGSYIAFAVLTIIFVHLASEIRENELAGFDTAVQTFIRSHSSQAMDKFMLFITYSSGPVPVTVLFLILIWIFFKKHMTERLIFVLLTMPGTVILNNILKLIFRRDRPDLLNLLITEKSFSFPSGHAMISSAIIMTILVLSNNLRRYRWILISGLFYIFLVGYSRVYLGVHYPSDIIGGWIISTAWVILSRRLVFGFREVS